MWLQRKSSLYRVYKLLIATKAVLRIVRTVVPGLLRQVSQIAYFPSCMVLRHSMRILSCG